MEMVPKSTSHSRCKGRIVEELWRPPPPVRVSRVSEPMRREWGGAGCSIPLSSRPAEQQNPSSNAAHEPPRPMQVFRVKPLLVLSSVITIQSIQPTFISLAQLPCFIDNIWQNIYDQCFQCQCCKCWKMIVWGPIEPILVLNQNFGTLFPQFWWAGDD